jgi:hypothetical protein
MPYTALFDMGVLIRLDVLEGGVIGGFKKQMEELKCCRAEKADCTGGIVLCSGLKHAKTM